jgi:hypothetical protein
MSKVKKAVFEDEEALQSIEELKETTEKISEPSDEEIENLFHYTPVQVEEIPQIDTGLVEIVPLRDDTFSFGGTWYHLTKGKRQLVSTHVRDFLLRNKQNPRIKDIY